MSSIISSTPQKMIKRESLKESSFDTSECLDLSIKECFVIIYYPASDPGNEYEILSEKDLMDTWDYLAKGAVVFVKFGNAKVQGTVITISDDLNYLTKNFKAITEEHQEFLKDESFKGRNHVSFRENRSPYIERHVIKVMDKETQTEDEKSLDPEYVELKRKYEDLRKEFNKFTLLFSDVKMGLKDTMSKLNNFKPADASSSSSTNLTPKNNILQPTDENKENVEDFNKMVQIGSEGTEIPKNIYDTINWSSYTAATRKLLITLFPRKVLATHSLTGKPSPAFLTSDKQTKMRLDPTIISDIVELISKNCKVSESLVRNAITTKCADENKLYRKRLQKRSSSDTENDIDEGRKKKKLTE